MSSKRSSSRTAKSTVPSNILAKRATNGWASQACIGSQIKGPCSRIDLMKKHAGIDVQAMYPAGEAPKADGWTTDTFLKAAEACHKGGVPFGIGLGETSDSVDTVGAFFLAFGAEVVDVKGNVVVKNDNVRQVLEYYKKLMAFLPSDAPAWDDGSNNRWLVSGKGALIMNPPSAWAVAKRDAPQIAEQCWTHGFPVGPKGRFAPYLPYFWNVWNFSKNKQAAKSLLMHLSQPAAVEKLVAASGGYDLPAFEKLTTLKTWAEESPPKGTLYHYPNPHKHQTLSISASPAPPKIAQQIYTQATLTKMCVRLLPGRGRWKRRWPGRKANSKASCGAEGAFAATARRFAGRGGAHPPADTIRSRRRAGFPTRKLPLHRNETREEDASWLMSRSSGPTPLRERCASAPACEPR